MRCIRENMQLDRPSRLPIPSATRYAFTTGTTPSFPGYTIKVSGAGCKSCTSGCSASYNACFAGGSSTGLFGTTERPSAFVKIGPYPMIANSIVGRVEDADFQAVGYCASRAAARWPPDDNPRIPRPSQTHHHPSKPTRTGHHQRLRACPGVREAMHSHESLEVGVREPACYDDTFFADHELRLPSSTQYYRGISCWWLLNALHRRGGLWGGHGRNTPEISTGRYG